MTSSSPAAATASASHRPAPLRGCEPVCSRGSANIAWASATPATAPPSCTATYGASQRRGRSRRQAMTSETAGLKCAPLTGPKTSIST